MRKVKRSFRKVQCTFRPDATGGSEFVRQHKEPTLTEARRLRGFWRALRAQLVMILPWTCHVHGSLCCGINLYFYVKNDTIK